MCGHVTLKHHNGPILCAGTCTTLRAYTYIYKITLCIVIICNSSFMELHTQMLIIYSAHNICTIKWYGMDSKFTQLHLLSVSCEDEFCTYS